MTCVHWKNCIAVYRKRGSVTLRNRKCWSPKILTCMLMLSYLYCGIVVYSCYGSPAVLCCMIYYCTRVCPLTSRNFHRCFVIYVLRSHSIVCISYSRRIAEYEYKVWIETDTTNNSPLHMNVKKQNPRPGHKMEIHVCNGCHFLSASFSWHRIQRGIRLWVLHLQSTGCP